MTQLKTPYEVVSYDLNKFQDRRIADMRKIPRGTKDRRIQQNENKVNQETQHRTAESETTVD